MNTTIIDRFFNRSHLGRITEVAFYGASIVFSAGLAIAFGVHPLAIFFGRFSVTVAVLRKNWKNLTRKIFWICLPLAVAYALNPFLLFFGIKMMGAEGSAFGALAFALMATVVAIWLGNKKAINPLSTRGFMNLAGFMLVVFKVWNSLDQFFSGVIGTEDIIGMLLIVIGVLAFCWYSVKLPTVIGKEVDGVKLNADSIVFVSSIVSAGSVGIIWIIPQLLTGHFENIGLVTFFAFITVSLWQSIVCTIRFQRRFAEARDDRNCGVIRASAFGMLMPAVGILLSFTLGSFSIVNFVIMLALFTVVGIFVSSKEFDEA